MAEYKLLLPSMGEGVMEATVISWLFNEGDQVNEDDSIVEIATDKVDSDVPTPVSGKIIKILVQKDEIAKVGEPIAILEIEGEGSVAETKEEISTQKPDTEVVKTLEEPLKVASVAQQDWSGSDLYLSPLVKSIVQEENISEAELKSIKGRGAEGRITKEDILEFVKNRGKVNTAVTLEKQEKATVAMPAAVSAPSAPILAHEGDEIIQMDRMRKIIADNMLRSKQIAPHVTSFIESDVTGIVNWRAKNKSVLKNGKVKNLPICLCL